MSPAGFTLSTFPLLLRLASLACSLALVSAVARAKAAPRTAADGELVVLPTLVVRAESMAFADWSKTVSPHFVVYSDHHASVVSAIVLHLEKLKAALDQLAGRPNVDPRPMVFVYPSHGSDWAKLEGLDRKEEWAARSVSWGIDHRITQLGVVREPGVLGRLLLGTDRAVGFYAILGGDFCSSHNLPGALWFNRGMAILAAYARVDASTVVFGVPNSRERHFSTRSPIPWERLFRLTSNSTEYRKTSSVLTLDAQSSLAVRYFITSRNPALQRELFAWLDHLAEDPPPDDAKFKELFGWDWPTWTQVIGDFAARGRQPSILEIGLAPEECSPPIRRADLRPVEMRELFLLSQIVCGGTRHGGDLLDYLLQKGLVTEALRPLLASACIREKRTETALATLRTLGRSGCSNPRVFEEAARLLLEQAVPNPEPDSRLGAEAGEIRALCASALALQPHSRAGNNLLAWTIAFDSPGGAETLDSLRQILQRQAEVHPTREIRAALALAAFRSGDTESARRTSLDFTAGRRGSDRATVLCRRLLARLDAGTPGSSDKP